MEDPRFATVSSRRTNKTELNQLIEELLDGDTSDNWVLRLNAVGVPCGPVNTVAEVFDDPQVKYLEIAKPVAHPVSGHIEILKNATNIEGVSSDIRMPSPLKGEHSRELLIEFGFTEPEIDRLAHSEAIQIYPG